MREQAGGCSAAATIVLSPKNAAATARSSSNLDINKTCKGSGFLMRQKNERVEAEYTRQIGRAHV